MGAHLLVLLCLPSHFKQCLTDSEGCVASKSEKKVGERGERERDLSSHSTRQSFAKLADLLDKLSQALSTASKSAGPAASQFYNVTSTQLVEIAQAVQRSDNPAAQALVSLASACTFLSAFL
jgi:hypothetical protein